MMRTLFSMLALLFLCMSGLQAQNLENAGEYLGVISKQQTNVSKKFMSYTSAAAHGKRARKVENLRQKLLNEVEEARMNIAGMPSFKGDKSLRDTAVNFMKFYYHILNDDYAKIINMEEVAEKSYDDMEAYLMLQAMVDQKLEEGNARMKTAVDNFAAANNIRIVADESELGAKLKQVRLTNDYYRDVYLLFFKPFIQESTLIEAVGNNNVTAIEQSKGTVLKYAQEALDKLPSIKPYEGDGSLIAACKSMMNFYIREANDGMKKVSDYLLVKERFEKMQKDFKEKNKPSKEDVDAYNKMVNEINQASSNYNNSMNELNRSRTENLNNWNKSVESFFDEHTPKYR